MCEPNVTWVVEYRPISVTLETTTTKFPGDYDGAVELRDAKLEEGLWVRCFIEGGE